MSVNVGTATGYLDLDATKWNQGFKMAAMQMKSFNDGTGTMGSKLQTLGGTLKTTGAAMTKSFTVPLVGVGAASVATAAKFEEGMSRVAALSGATGEDLEALTNKAKEMGSTTKFSATESASALEYMALAGWSTQESIDGLGGVLDLAASSGMDLASASDMVTDFLSAFQEEADQAGRMADVFAYAQANSNTSTEQLGAALKNCAVNANGFGMDIEQTSAVLGKLADQNLKGSEAGTALSAVFRDMTSKMKDGAIAIGDTNVKITDANGNFRDMTDIVKDVESATDGMSESQKVNALQTTFTADSIKAMQILLASGSDELINFTNELYNSSGTASEMSNIMQNNLNGQLTALKSALEGAAISIGNALLPVVKVLVQWIQNAVNWFNNLSPSIQTAIVIFGGLVAAIGPVLMIIGQMCIGIGGLITFFGAGGAGAGLFATAIALITGPVGLVIAAIVGLIAVGVLLYQNWDVVKAKCSEVWEAIKTTVTTVWETISNTTMSIWNSVSSFLNGIWEGIKGFISPAVNFVKDIISIAWNSISTITSTIWNSIKGIIQSVWELIKSVINLALAVVKVAITSAWNVIKSITTTVWNAIKSVIQTVWNAIKPIVQTGTNLVKSVVTSAWNSIKSITTTVWNGIKSAIQTVWNGIKSVVTSGANLVKSTISSVFSTLTNIMTAPFKAAQSVISGILGGITSAINKVTSSIKKVTGMFKAMPNPNQPSEEDVDAMTNDFDYSSSRFNYASARNTSVSDVVASNRSMVDVFENFASGINKSNKQGDVNTENTINVSLNIDRFVNESKQDVDDLMNQIAFKLKRQKISIGGA